MHSTADVCRASGLSYRQVDHWLTTGVLRTVDIPNPGSGQGRTMSPTELTVACVLASMRDLNAPLYVLTRVAEQLRMLDDTAWTGLLFVDPEGWVARTHHDVHASWIVDLDQFAHANA